jgi:hypothetical protein
VGIFPYIDKPTYEAAQHTLPYIRLIVISKYSRIRWAEHMGRTSKVSSGHLGGRPHLGDLGVGRRIVLKWI